MRVTYMTSCRCTRESTHQMSVLSERKLFQSSVTFSKASLTMEQKLVSVSILGGDLFPCVVKF
jgi:hypothetical protein